MIIVLSMKKIPFAIIMTNGIQLMLINEKKIKFNREVFVCDRFHRDPSKMWCDVIDTTARHIVSVFQQSNAHESVIKIKTTCGVLCIRLRRSGSIILAPFIA